VAAGLAVALADELEEPDADSEVKAGVLEAADVAVASAAEPEIEAVDVAELDSVPVAVVVSLMTRNQFAATGWPRPAASAKPDILKGYLALTSAGGLNEA
jgi:hypothetical protein